jgi:glycosyltransferase involved in cell wall biosynthesis
VASNVGGVAEAVRHGRTGYVVQRQSVSEMREALQSLISDPFRRAGFGAEGRRDYEQKFTFRRLFDETVSIYEQIMGVPATVPALQRREEWQPQR